ncbi:hypothetical protein ERJ75_001374900 [Trypanosoma vivax]|nr:hypothetical protein ERJ75_001374900 [Trypanosoma vivax]
MKDGELFFSAQLVSFLKELFKLESPSAPTPDEPELRRARAVKRHRSPTELVTTYPLCGSEADWGVHCKSHAKACPERRLGIQGNLLQFSAGRSENEIWVAFNVPCWFEGSGEQPRV